MTSTPELRTDFVAHLEFEVTIGSKRDSQPTPATGAGERVSAVRRAPAEMPLGTQAGAPVLSNDAPGTLSVLRSVHLALRGKYIWSLVLGIASGGLVAFAAWRVARPIYHSEALLKIAYTLPEVIQETDQNKPLAQFDTFMLSQRMVIGSRRILDQAVMDPVWKNMKREVPQAPDLYFAKNLKVETKPRSEYIQISVTDYDPGTAAAAVNSISAAYYAYCTELATGTEGQRISALEGKIKQAAADIKNLHDKEAAIVKEYGTANLDKIFEQALDRVAKTTSALDDLRIAMTGAPATPSGGGATGPTSPLTIEQLALSDITMRGYVSERERIEKDLRHYRTLGLGDANRTIVTATQDLDDINNRISKHLSFCNELRSVTGTQVLPDGKSAAVSMSGKSLGELKESEGRLIKLQEVAKEEVRKLSQARLELEPLETKLAAQRADLSKLTARLGVLQTEQSLGNGRLTIISTGEIPLSPDRDLRPALSGVGGVIGAFLPSLFFFIRYQLTRRVYHYSDETQTDIQAGTPLLGILPVLDELGGDREQAMSAAHSIHQIRVSLNSRATPGRSVAYLVTSAAAGEGKTSVTMSLALSFAASRARTLVIDGDLIGRRFTHNLKAADVEGLHEALNAGSMNRLVRRTDSGVSVLTTGKGSMLDACGIGAEKMRKLIAQARAHFDVILIDTGPILGSVEAAVLAQEVDSVIFTVAKGQRRALVENSLRRLKTLGVQTAGIIFNRAQASDFNSSPYGSSSTSMKLNPVENDRKDLSCSRSLANFGPMVKAVASGIPASQN